MRFPVVLGWGLCGELGTHISSLQFSKFDVRGDVPGRPAVCGLASRSPESARRAARADIARRKCRDGEPCGVQHPTVPVSRGDHKGHYLPTSSQQGCNCYRVCACVSRVTRLVRAGPITDGAKPHETVKTPGPESSASRTHALHSHSVIE